MRIVIYSCKDFEKNYLVRANNHNQQLTLIPTALNENTAKLAEGQDAVVIFTADVVNAAVLLQLHAAGVKYIAVRAAGYDNVDLKEAARLGFSVANVPAYSPYAVAEHAVALMLALNRKLILANKQVQAADFTVGNLIGFDLYQKTVGIVGTGRIGSVLARIMHGFGCRLLGFDIRQDQELVDNYNLQYTDIKELCRQSDIISLHTPLNAFTKHLINRQLIAYMKPGVMLINTARGAVMNTADVMEALEQGKIGSLGADVYEYEKGIFFHNHSATGIEDNMLKKLIHLPNVIITPHQAFATTEALENIANTTFYNLNCWAAGRRTENELTYIELPAENAKPDSIRS
jgi:D-lactate dehydrogenase